MTWYVALPLVAVTLAAVRVSLWYLRAAVEWLARPRPDRVSQATRARLRYDYLRGDG